MTEARNLWNQIATKHHLLPGSDQEREYLARYLEKMDPATFNSNLSRGFSRKHGPDLARLCADNGIDFEPGTWFEEKRRAAKSTAFEPIAWEGRPIVGTDDFYRQLQELYGSVRRYRCLRVGGIFSRNRTSFEKFDKQHLAEEPAGANIRMPYLQLFWGRLRTRELVGLSVHVVRTIDRLIELWACVELLRKHDLHHSNPIYLAPIASRDSRQDHPAMGVRILDDKKTLLSLPALQHGSSVYSSWIDAERLARFAGEYLERVKSTSEELTRIPVVGIRPLMEDAFFKLFISGQKSSSNYGIIDSFQKAETMKDRMIHWADRGTWLPVIG
jgi:hypothetical protein